MAKDAIITEKEVSTIKAAPEPVIGVRITKIQIALFPELLVDGEKEGDMEPIAVNIFEKGFGQKIDLVKIVTEKCSELQGQIKVKK